MLPYRIFMSNLGYLRGINGRLIDHVRYLHRHFYCPVDVQKQALQQLIALLEAERPDICCFVEIEKGSSDCANFNQIEALLSDAYAFYDIENKYGPASRLLHLPRTRGKSNAFLAKQPVPFEKIYLSHGTKRLIYKLTLPSGVQVFFTHFSLQKSVRKKQFTEMRQLLEQAGGECMLLGDFNVMGGFGELAPLLEGSRLRLLSDERHPTFTFHRFEKALDLCLCSDTLAERVQLRIVPQPFSDHSALLVEIAHA